MTSNKPELSSVENLMKESVRTQMRHDAFCGPCCTNVSILSSKAVCRKAHLLLLEASNHAVNIVQVRL